MSNQRWPKRRDDLEQTIRDNGDGTMSVIWTKKLYTFDVYWSPEGKKIATVQAHSELAAIRKAPQPYRKFLGEMYAVKVSDA